MQELLDAIENVMDDGLDAFDSVHDNDVDASVYVRAVIEAVAPAIFRVGCRCVLDEMFRQMVAKGLIEPDSVPEELRNH